MGKIAHPRGRVIAQVDFYRIYQKDSKKVEEVNGVKREKTTGTSIAVYHRKNLVKDGFKNKESAVSAAKELLQEHYAKLGKDGGKSNK